MQALEFTTLFETLKGTSRKGTHIITDVRTLRRRIGARMISTLNIDLSQHTVIVAARGKCPTAGYGIKITNIYDDNGTLQVETENINPKKGLRYYSKPTRPAQVVLIERNSTNY